MNTERIWEIFERVRKAAIDYIVEVFGLEVEEVIGKTLFVPMIPLDEKPVLLDDGKYHLPLGQCRTRKDLTLSVIFLNMKEMIEENYSFDLMVGICVHEIVHAIINHFRITPEIFSEATLIRLVHFCGGKAYGSNSAREGEWSEAICEYLCYKRANMGKIPLIPALEGTINHIIYGMKHPVRR